MTLDSCCPECIEHRRGCFYSHTYALMRKSLSGLSPLSFSLMRLRASASNPMSLYFFWVDQLELDTPFSTGTYHWSEGVARGSRVDANSQFHHFTPGLQASLVDQMGKNLPATQETWVRSLDQQDPLTEVMATHSSIIAWRISWTEEPGRLWSLGLQRERQDWATNTFTFHLKRGFWKFYTSMFLYEANNWLNVLYEFL